MRWIMMACVMAFGASPARALQAATADRTDAEKIADASRAASAELTRGARFLDWPSAEGGEFRVMREGTNGWICMPDPPGDALDEPMCMDQEWLDWMRAYMAGEAPNIRGVGVSYMLNSTWSASNTDPAATGPAPGNAWHSGGSHLMLIAPGPDAFAGFPTEPTPEGGAYVMFAGTPYVHLIVPIPEAHAGGGGGGRE